MNYIAELLPAIREAMAEYQTAFKKSLEAQGHVLTGKLRDSIVYEIEQNPTNITATMFIEDYGLAVEFGVPAANIPYSGNSGSGGTSKYIQGLIRFFELRGLAEREAKGAAFATANKHKKEGMPTRASSAFSQTGKRTEFIKDAIDSEGPRINAELERKFGVIIQVQFDDNFEGYENIRTA